MPTGILSTYLIPETKGRSLNPDSKLADDPRNELVMEELNDDRE